MENFANDKRLLKKDDMTQQKGITFANCLDFDIYAILKDKDSDVPNPIGDPIIIKLTGGDAGFYNGFSPEQVEEVTNMANSYPGTTDAVAYSQYYTGYCYDTNPYQPPMYNWYTGQYYNPYQYGMYWGNYL